MALLPHCDLVLAGFPCTDKSPLGKHAARSRTHIMDEVGVTGGGFKSTRAFAAHHMPLLHLLENVVQVDACGDERESQHMVDSFHAVGYGVRKSHLEAREYSSFPARRRLYMNAGA